VAGGCRWSKRVAEGLRRVAGVGTSGLGGQKAWWGFETRAAWLGSEQAWVVKECAGGSKRVLKG